MKYNVAKEGLVESNLTVGNVSASFNELEGLMENQASLLLAGADNDIFCVDIDLGNRILLEEARYYFSSSTISGTTASGISFYYRDNVPDGYTQLPVSISSGYYSATFSGSSAPRFVRLVHTLSGTAISGTATGLYLINDDTIIDFGTDGTKTSQTITSAASAILTTTIPIYNSGVSASTAYALLEPGGSYDEYVFLSNSESGPWTGMTENVIADEDNWTQGDIYSYSAGVNRMKVDQGQLKINSVGGTGGQGTYTTPIVYYDTSTFSMLNISGYFPNDDCIKVDESDGNQTYEVIESFSAPKRFGFFSYRSLLYNNYQDQNYYFLRRHERWLVDGTLKKDGSGGCFGAYHENFNNYECAEDLDPYDDSTGVLFVHGMYSNTYYHFADSISLHRYEDFYGSVSGRNGETGYSVNIYFEDLGYKVYTTSTVVTPLRIWIDSSKGCWLYYHVTGASNMDAGYYLEYYDYNMVRKFREYSSTKKYYDMDVVYSESCCWVSDATQNAIYKLDYEGNQLITYIVDLEEPEVRGLCTSSDGGCWFINGDYDVYKLSSEGELVYSITDISLDYALNYVYLDKDDSNRLWLVAGDQVINFEISTERVMFTKNYQGIINTRSFKGGLSVGLDDHSFHFLDKIKMDDSATRADSLGITGVFSSDYDNVNLSKSTYDSNDLLTGGSISASISTNQSYLVNNDRHRNYWDGAGAPCWIKYDFGAGNDVIANGIGLTAIDYGYSLYFEGSNNDTDWVRFGAFSTGSSVVDYKYYLWHAYNNTAYRYYRVYFYYSSHPSSGPRIMEWELLRVYDKFPNEKDTEWGSLEWKKVGYESHLLSSQPYKKFRTTFRTSSTDDPVIDGIYLYDGVEVGAIQPGASKDLYLKVVTPEDITSSLGEHDTNLKVWWDIPI